MAASEQDLSALEPATITHIDFRPPAAKDAARRAAAAGAATGGTAAGAGAGAGQQGGRPLRLVTWNIERGYELPKIIELLKEVDADILSLQELDIGCDRSGGADTFSAIGRALGLNGLFLCEFRELRSPLRGARAQGGGVHGNAVFSRFDFASWRVLEHSHHPIDWEAPAHPLAAKEPRKGRRATLVADVAAPGGAVRLYNCHLEVFCGILARLRQFADILRDVKAAGAGDSGAAAAVEAAGGEADGAAAAGAGAAPARFAILGDLNTMANGVARLSPHYCCDALRWRTLGTSEAAYWQRHVIECTGPAPVNAHFLALGLPEETCRALVNPGFSDPFDPDADITLDNPAYRLGPLSLMTGKLDWVLLMGLRPAAWRMGNLDWAASDHRMLVVEADSLTDRRAGV